MSTQQEHNAQRSMVYIAHTIEQNFTGADLYLTFGYLPGREPRSREAAAFLLRDAVIDPLRRLRRAQGVPCKYAYSTKWTQGDTPAEHRLILSAGQETPEMLVSLWRYGAAVCRPLRELEPLYSLACRLYREAGQTVGRYGKPIVRSHNVR